MNKENIVKEGILEAYFLGDLSPAQEEEAFKILQSDSELMKYYKNIERSMEKVAFENAMTPPNKVKEAVFEQISKTNREKSGNKKVITSIFYKRYFRVAASIAILFMTASLVLWFNLNDAKQELKSKLSEQESLMDSINLMTKKATQKEEFIAYVNNPKTKRYLLHGNSLSPEAAVLSYVNHEKESVLINIHKLPELKGQDYQMWADVDGKMIDMGVIDSSQQMLTMNYVKNAKSINITIEEKGGSDHPDVSKLIGSVSL